MVTCLVTLTDL